MNNENKRSTWTYLAMGGLAACGLALGAQWMNQEVATEETQFLEGVGHVPMKELSLNQKACKQSGPHSAGNPCTNAFLHQKGKWSHTEYEKGGWWEVPFSQPSWVAEVKIFHLYGSWSKAIGNRLQGTNVFVDDQLCGQVTEYTTTSAWYVVRCRQPLHGGKVRLVSTRKGTPVHISDFKAFGWDHSTPWTWMPFPTGKVALNKGACSESGPYQKSYPCTNAFLHQKMKYSHTDYKKDQWFEVPFSQPSWVQKVRMFHIYGGSWSSDGVSSVGNRLQGVNVFVDGQLCGQVTQRTRTDTWYEVTCRQPIFGHKVRLVSTRAKMPIHLSDFEVIGWNQAGPFHGMKSTKIALNNASASESGQYQKSYPATNAFLHTKMKYSHTDYKAGEYWQVDFARDAWVEYVRIFHIYADGWSDAGVGSVGNRLQGTQVFVDGQMCGTVTQMTKRSTWYVVKCAKPLFGHKVRLVSTRAKTPIHISDFEVYGW